MFESDFNDLDCPLKSIESSCEILSFTDDACLFSLRYDACDIKSFECNSVTYNETAQVFVPYQNCTEAFYEFDSWQTLR
jgi:hypothetical protein